MYPVVLREQRSILQYREYMYPVVLREQRSILQYRASLHKNKYPEESSDISAVLIRQRRRFSNICSLKRPQRYPLQDATDLFTYIYVPRRVLKDQRYPLPDSADVVSYIFVPWRVLRDQRCPSQTAQTFLYCFICTRKSSQRSVLSLTRHCRRFYIHRCTLNGPQR